MVWEYRVENTLNLSDDLNRLGGKGWRFVGYVGSKYVFERRKPISLWVFGIGFCVLVVMSGIASIIWKNMPA